MLAFSWNMRLAEALMDIEVDLSTSSTTELAENKKIVKVHWLASEESIFNGEGFAVERAELGSSWAEVGRVMATNEAKPREVQLIETRADEGQSITSGFFRLSMQKDGLFDADPESPSTTPWISYSASEGEIVNALESLGNIESVQVKRSGPDAQGGYQWTVTFMDAGEAYPALQVVASTLDASFLGSQIRTVGVSEIRPGRTSSFACLNNPDKRDPYKDKCFFDDSSVEPYKVYLYRVRALVRDLRGTLVWSHYSNPSRTISIPGGRKLATASNIQVISIAEDYFRVQLQGAPEGAKIQIQMSAGVWQTLPRATSGDSSDFVAGNLEADTDYLVRALVPGQDATHTTTKTIHTAEKSRSDIELSVNPSGPESILVTWAQNHDRVLEFQMQARELKDGRRSTEFLDGDNSLWSYVNMEGQPPYYAGQAEVQTITTRIDPGSGVINGGSFTLAFRDTRSPTSALPYDISASALRTALSGLGITAKSVTRSSRTTEHGYTYTIVFNSIYHQGDQPPLVVISESISRDSDGYWSGPGGPVAVSTIKNGILPRYAPQSEYLNATVNGLKPYTWYAFRMREIHIDTDSGRQSAGSWTDPVGPIRTEMSPETLVDAPPNLDLLDARSRALANIILDIGVNGSAPHADDPQYVNGVGVGGGLNTGGIGSEQYGFAGGPGLVSIRPRSIQGSGIAESFWPAKLFFYTGSTEVYEIPNDPLIDSLEVKLWGAGGGSTGMSPETAHGGAGAFLQATLSKQILTGALHVRVGGGGHAGGSQGQGGWNGGGSGGKGVLRHGAGGGGASSILLHSSMDTPILTAAGGGGAGGSDYCCANGGDAHQSGSTPDSSLVLLGLDDVDPNTRLFADHNNKDIGHAPLADYSILAVPGFAGSTILGGQGGQSGSLASILATPATSASNGGHNFGGDGAGGFEGGGGGGGGYFGGGGGGSGVEGAGGGGGSSFANSAYLMLSRNQAEAVEYGYIAPKIWVADKNHSSITLQWSKQSGAGYLIEASTGIGNEDFKVIKNIDDVNQTVLKGLTADTLYSIRIRAVSPREGPEMVGNSLMVRTKETPYPAWSSVPFRPFAMPIEARFRTSSDIDARLLSTPWSDDPASGSGRANDDISEMSLENARWMPRHGHSATRLENGRIYLFGGYTDGFSCELPGEARTAKCVQGRRSSNELWVYDPDAKVWTIETRFSETTLPEGRGLHSAVQWNNYLYIFGGLNLEKVSQTNEQGETPSITRNPTTGRISSFTIKSSLSQSSLSEDWRGSSLNSFYVYDPTQSSNVVIESASPVYFADFREGALLPSPGVETEGSLIDSMESGSLCINRVRQLTLVIDHPCPNSLRIWLRGAGYEARNVDDTLGILVFDRDSSARPSCNPNSNKTVQLTLNDDASSTLREAFAFQTSGTYRPSSPISVYEGVLYNPEGWSIYSADEEMDQLTSGGILSWQLELEIHPCEPKPSWTNLTNITSGPPARYSHSSFALNGAIYIFGGKDPNEGLRNDLWVYNIQTNNWDQRGEVSMDAFRDTEIVVPMLNLGRILMFDSFHTAPLSSLDVYSGTRTVITLEDQNSVPVPRTGAAIAVHGDTLWMFGGYAGVASLDDTWTMSIGRITSRRDTLRERCFGIDTTSDLSCDSNCTGPDLYLAFLCTKMELEEDALV